MTYPVRVKNWPTLMQGEKAEAYLRRLYRALSEESQARLEDLYKTWKRIPFTLVTDYGAKGDGVFDDTDSIQAAMTAAAGGVLFFPGGTYMVTPVAKTLAPASDTTIWFSPGAIIKNLAHAISKYVILYLDTVDNVHIIGGEIDGNRDANTVVGGEHGHGLRFKDSTNCSMEGMYIKNCWGDGIYMAGNDTITLSDFTCDNNRRNGFSLISGRHIKVVRPHLKNTNGTAPQMGMDIEPNAITDYLEDIQVVSAHTEDNESAGINISLQNMSGATDVVSITISNHFSDDDSVGFGLGQVSAAISGTIRYIDGTIRLPYGNGIGIRNYGAVGPRVDIIRPVIIDPNTNQYTTDRYGSGISVYAEGTDTGVSIGNIHIYNASILTTTTAHAQNAFHVKDLKAGCAADSVSIIDPLQISIEAGALLMTIEGVTNLVISDKYNKLVMDRTASITARGTNVARKYTNSGATGNIGITLEKNPIGYEFTFEVSEPYRLFVIPEATDTIIPKTSTAGSSINSRTVGSKISIKKVTADEWWITEEIGPWFSGYPTRLTVAATTYSVLDTDETVVCNSAGAFTVTLPQAYGYGRTYTIKNIGTGLVTLNAYGSETIDGDLTIPLSTWDSITVVDYGTGTWAIV
jgi:hypothetical protein